MQREVIFDQLRDALKISATEPTTYFEFISCLFDIEDEGAIPSCTKIIKRLWPDEFEQASDKIQFRAKKWDLLRKRRNKINERIFDSPLLFSYFIQLTTDKEFRILYSPDDIFHERLEEFESSKARTSALEDQKKIEENIRLLHQRFNALKIGSPHEIGVFSISLKPSLRAGVVVLFILLILVSGISLYTFFPEKPSAVGIAMVQEKDAVSIAIIPFKSNIPVDSEKHFFNQGLSDGIIAALARFPQMMVISRNSVEHYQGQVIDVRTIGKELGVKHVVSGNTYISDDRIQISVRLNNVETGQVLWADHWDEEQNDLFSLQDEITLRVLVALQVKLSEGEKALTFVKGTRNINAYSKLMEGYYYFFQETFMDTLRARRLGEEAITEDPDYAAAYALLADTYLKDFEQNEDIGQISKAYNLIEKGARTNPDDPAVHNVYSRVYWYRGEYKKALRAAEKSLEIAPNFVEGLCWYGALLNWMGQHQTAIMVFEQAVRLDPKDHTLSYLFMGWAYRDLGDYESAIYYLEKAYLGRPLNVDASIHLAACYVAAGRISAAKQFIKKVLILDPTVTIDKIVAKPSIGLSPNQTKQFNAWLRLAGMP